MSDARASSPISSASATTGSCSGHRLSEWCGHGPILEEDIALANIALDLIGQATLFLKLAGEIEGQGATRTRSPTSATRSTIRNALIVELPKGDFAFTIVRQFFFSVFSLLQMEALQQSANADARGHRRQGGEGSALSRSPQRAVGRHARRRHRREPRARAAALDDLWRYTGELFIADAVDRAGRGRRASASIPASLAAAWRAQVGR